MRTDDNLKALILELEGNCGDLYTAARSCGLSPAFVRKWMADDADVNSSLTEAMRVGAGQLESEAIRRAAKGYRKAVYYQGEVVGYEDVYSDGLMQTLLKKRLPETYGEDSVAAGVSVNILNSINIMPRANTYEDWLRMRDMHVNGTGENNLPALEAPTEQIEDAEFEKVLPPPEEDPAMADIL